MHNMELGSDGYDTSETVVAYESVDDLNADGASIGGALGLASVASGGIIGGGALMAYNLTARED